MEIEKRISNGIEDLEGGTGFGRRNVRATVASSDVEPLLPVPNAMNILSATPSVAAGAISPMGYAVLILLAVQNCSKNLLMRYVMKDRPEFLTSAAVLGYLFAIPRALKAHASRVSTRILDVMYAFWAALRVLPVPKETGGVFAKGNVATCSTQAFFVNAPGSILLYMAMLSTYFMLKIRYNVSDAIMERRYEIWFHVLPLGVWLVTGILGLSLKIFGPLLLPELGCWIGSYPYGCFLTDTCTRGFRVLQYNDWYVWTFSFMWMFLCVIIVVVNSILIYTAIRKQERRNENYLAAKLQKRGPSSDTTSKILSSSPNSGSEPVTASELPLPDFDFVDTGRELSGGAALFADDGLLSSHMVKNSPDDDASNNKVNENPLTVHTRVVDDTIREEEEVVVDPVTSLSEVPGDGVAVQSSCYILSALFTAVWTFIPWVGYKLQVEAPVRFFSLHGEYGNTGAGFFEFIDLCAFAVLAFA